MVSGTRMRREPGMLAAKRARAGSVTRSRIVVHSFGAPGGVLSATSSTVGILGNAGAASISLIIARTS